VRVAYEQTGLELDATGSARAARDLRDALVARGDVEVVALAHPRGRIGGRVARGLLRELTWFPGRLAGAVRRTGADLLHCPMPLAPVIPVGVPVVVTINDAIPWEYPQWLTRENAWHARLVLAPALRRAAGVIVPSRHTRERLLASVRGLDPERIFVTPYGIGREFTPGQPDAREPFVLAVGTLQPRKNLETALQAFERLVADGLPHRLTIVGGRGWRDAALLERIEASPAGERITRAGHVGEAELVALYRSAACLLYPSRAEGFGFPPLEAMACGTPSVVSTAGSLPEVVGEAAPCVDPDDATGLAQAVRDVIEHREAWRRRGLARAAAFSWARCAQETVAAYRAVNARTRRIVS
jgi:glycosyltransferase involved in cell wall biosynthesis